MHKSIFHIVLRAIVGCTFVASNALESLAQPAATQPAGRDFETILDEYQKVNAEVVQLIRSPDELLDPARRVEIGKAAVPKLNQLGALADEMSTLTGPTAQFGVKLRGNVDPVLAIFGDADAIARLEKLAASDVKAESLKARAALLSAEWVRSDRNAETQTKLLDRAELLAKENPSDDNVAELLMRLSEAGPATPEIQARARAIVTDTLKGDLATEIKNQFAADAKLATLVGQPLVLEGKLHTGEAFNSDSLKGKVVVVDFFVAEWPPSRNITVLLATVRDRWKDKGVEFVGVCNDANPPELKRLLTENPQVTWPILFDEQNPGVHKIAETIGLTDPRLLVIDKAGIVKSVDAAADLEKLLAELTK